MRRDGLYRLQTNTPVEQVSSAEVLAHYKNSRQLQCIRLGRLEVQGQSLKTKVTRIPKNLKAILGKLGLLPLLAQETEGHGKEEY